MPPKKATPSKSIAKAPAKGLAKGPAKGGAKKPAVGVAAKPGVASKTAKSEPKKIEKKWTPQDEAARKIQCLARRYLAKCKLLKLKKEKEDYQQLMEQLEKEAFVKVVKMQQEEADRQMRKEEELRKRKAAELKRRKRMLEAAFDGDNDEIEVVLKEQAEHYKGNDDGISKALQAKAVYNMVECEDANGNTPLSEAAAGGIVETLKLLINKGASPNTKGAYGRTPLYRAAFAGHLEAVQYLLQCGADPRIFADDGQTPEQTGSLPAVIQTLAEWDIEQTERLLKKLEADKERRLEDDRKRREAEASKLEDQVAEAEKEYKQCQKQVCKATEEWNKRITEHDESALQGFNRPDITIQVIHDAEAELEVAKMRLEKAQEKWSQLRLQLREKRLEGNEGTEEELPGLKILVRELDEVLLRDVGDRIKDSGKWPLIIDPSGQASTFIRYRDTNYLNALSPMQMEPEKIRMAALGSIRYGKPLVLDMMQVDMFETCNTRFDDVQRGLMNMIFDRSILKEENYLKLVRETDGDNYKRTSFNDVFTQKFKFWIITSNPFPNEDLIQKMYPIRVTIPQ